jgi:hypothetical protein
MDPGRDVGLLETLTLPTGPPFALGSPPVGVCLIKGMTAPAMGYPLSLTARVLCLRDRFHVGWVHAPRVVAQVVNGQALRDRTHRQFVGDPVRS